MLTLDLETFILFGKVIYLNRNTSNRKLKCGSLQSLVEPGHVNFAPKNVFN